MSRPLPPRRRATPWAALLIAPACPAASARPNFTVQPVAAPADAEKREPEDGLRCMLDDRPVRVTAAEATAG